VVAALRDLEGQLPRRERRDLREVGAGREHIGFARDGDRVDLAPSGPPGERVERLGQLSQGERPEGVRAAVVTAVVQCDEGEGAARGESDIAHERVRDDLVHGRVLEVGEIQAVVVGHGLRHFLLPV
jgi:hypothetical protein